MNKAKAAVNEFLSRDGKHDTAVHETVNPAVQNEHVTRTQNEETQRVVDREVHQDHYHTTVQPIKHREVQAEQHSQNVMPTEHREVKHGDDENLKLRLDKERAQFKDTQEIGAVKHTSSQAPTVGSEHIHHRKCLLISELSEWHYIDLHPSIDVHETIQPIIQKETIQPSVVHTTIPVHEVHHKEAKHHNASALPAISMEDFKRQGGSLGGREERTDAFSGEPRNTGNALGANGANSHALGGRGADGTASLTEHNSKLSHDKHTGVGHGSSTTSAGTGASVEKPKASLLDKLNPKTDSNGDGKAGLWNKESNMGSWYWPELRRKIENKWKIRNVTLCLFDQLYFPLFKAESRQY
jgi:hypothetical protein